MCQTIFRIRMRPPENVLLRRTYTGLMSGELSHCSTQSLIIPPYARSEQTSAKFQTHESIAKDPVPCEYVIVQWKDGQDDGGHGVFQSTADGWGIMAGR